MQDQYHLTQLVQDARRFIMYHKGAIESYPLQTYMSALLFSPIGSLIRQQFQHEEPRGITVKPAMSDNWSTCLQTLEGHSGWVMSVAFSPDDETGVGVGRQHRQDLGCEQRRVPANTPGRQMS
jgi:WD40 repeat protein